MAKVIKGKSYAKALIKQRSQSSAKAVHKAVQLADDSVGFVHKGIKYAASADTQIAGTTL